jgi:large subunit ribosomal protein L25
LRRGGILNIVRHGVELSCQADSIPEQLVVALDGLDIGDSVHASAVSFPTGSRPTVADRDFTIASIAAPSALREEAAAAAAAPPPAVEQLAAS